MTRDMDKIQFEHRYEIEEIIRVISKYIEQNPSEKNNDTLKRLYDLLDIMDMTW